MGTPASSDPFGVRPRITLHKRKFLSLNKPVLDVLRGSKVFLSLEDGFVVIRDHERITAYRGNGSSGTEGTVYRDADGRGIIRVARFLAEQGMEVERLGRYSPSLEQGEVRFQL